MGKIYTRRGDKGETSLGDQTRVQKSDQRIELIGSLDELNAILGLATSQYKVDDRLKPLIIDIQRELFAFGAEIAFSSQKKSQSSIKQETKKLENMIDELWEKLPPLNNFILPGGTQAAATLHLARTVARRTERVAARLNKNNQTINLARLAWLNRLSDFLFVAARYANYRASQPDELWR